MKEFIKKRLEQIKLIIEYANDEIINLSRVQRIRLLQEEHIIKTILERFKIKNEYNSTKTRTKNT